MLAHEARFSLLLPWPLFMSEGADARRMPWPPFPAAACEAESCRKGWRSEPHMRLRCCCWKLRRRAAISCFLWTRQCGGGGGGGGIVRAS